MRTLIALVLALLVPLASAAAAPKPAAPADTAAHHAVADVVAQRPSPSPQKRGDAKHANTVARPDSTWSDDERLLAALARMTGVVPGSDSLVDWPLFRAHAQRTVELILPTLQPVKRDLWLGAPNMVWRVRVLQRLTGLEFRGETRAKLTADEKKHLAPDSTRTVRFAGEDRALGMTWTAPADAQKAVFARWRQWWDQDAKKPELPLKKHDDDKTWWY